MDLIKAEELARQLIKEHLGDSKNRWNFKWTHAKRSFGSCNVSQRGAWGDLVCTIRLSKSLTKLNGEARVRNTILHEIAHALQFDKSGYMSHDFEWKRIAKSIGCDGERCFGDDVNMPTSKYTLLCETCGNETPKHRIPKLSYACGKCCKQHNGGKFSTDYIMILKEN
jgi:predicted SprT family Zn-dependent metalloprotease